MDIQAPDTSSYHDDPLMEMEAAILRNPKDLLRARSALRQLLFRDLGEEEQGRSIGDALAAINRGQSDRLVAIVLVRCLAVDGLLPSSNAANQIDRLITEISESRIPDVCTFIGLQPKSQTYEKISVLARGHERICNLLQPLIDGYGDLHALAQARKSILGSLNHSMVRAYGNPFRLAEFRSATESLFSRLSAAANDPKRALSHHYILWGDVAHSDPAACIRLLGESIERFVCRELPNEIKFQSAEYLGSLHLLLDCQRLPRGLHPRRNL